MPTGEPRLLTRNVSLQSALAGITHAPYGLMAVLSVGGLPMDKHRRQAASNSHLSAAGRGIHALYDLTVSPSVGVMINTDSHHRLGEPRILLSAVVRCTLAHCGKTAAPNAGVGMTQDKHHHRTVTNSYRSAAAHSILARYGTTAVLCVGERAAGCVNGACRSEESDLFPSAVVGFTLAAFERPGVCCVGGV